MPERKRRHWNYFTMDQVMEIASEATSESVWNGELETEQIGSSAILAGRILRLEFTNGKVMEYEFHDKRYLSWRVDDSGWHKDAYSAVLGPGHEEIVFLHHYKAGFDLPQCSNMVIDLETGLVTAIEATAGDPDSPREVCHDILFGHIAGFDVPASALRHAYTTELVGKAIYWKAQNTTRPGIKYIFSSPDYYTYAMRFANEDTYWMATHPADQIKIKNGLYLMSVVEARQTGFQLNMLMNLDTMRDCQSGFGVGASGPAEHPDRLEMHLHEGRYGSYTTMDTVL
jgi:hypothetical protein